MDNLKALAFTEFMSTDQGRRCRPKLWKVHVNEQVKREVRESIVHSPKIKETGRNALFVEATSRLRCNEGLTLQAFGKMQ